MTPEAAAPRALGVLNINKPSGLSSFAVVARVRKAAHVKRAGHAGTLDPLASGVLLVCLGQATRIVPYLQDAPKVYLAGICLGQRTDTYDSEGQVVEELPVPNSLDLTPYTGDIWQKPPLYSALKRGGRPLYDYARNGEQVDIEARQVHVERIDLVDWRPPFACLRIRCGKGTYVRSLANDLGGHLVSLVREAVGHFSLDSAMPLDELAAWENHLVSIDAALPGMPHVAVEAGQMARLRNGLSVEAPPGEALALDASGLPVALLRDGRPHIVFGAPSS